MIEKITPPIKDTKDDRLRFYYDITNNVAYNYLLLQNQMNIVQDNLSIFKTSCADAQNRVKNIEEEIIISKARINTIVGAVAVVWLLISAIFGWWWDKTTSRAEGLFATVTKLEDSNKENKHVLDALINDVNSLKSMKSMIMTIQDNIEMLNNHKDKQ